jgi:uncharacterized protein YlxW (UPF0749 family)
MGPFEMVVAIVLIVTIGHIIRARYKANGTQLRLADDPEAQRMRDEIKTLKERLAVLERITIEKENALEREIELLRDR